MTREQQKQIEDAVRKKTAELCQQYPGLNFTQPRIQVIRPSTEISGEWKMTFDEIKQIFDSWREQAMQEEKTALLWNALLDDIRMKFESERAEP